METDAPKVKAHKGKGTTTVTLDLDDSDDDVFDAEAEHAQASSLTQSTINENTSEKVTCQLEKDASTGKFVCYFVLFDLNFIFLFLFQTSFVFVEEFFPAPPSQKETTIDIGKMKDVAQEPTTLAEALEIVPVELTLRHTRGAWSTTNPKV